MSTMFTSYIFFFNDTATTEIYTLSLHDALPISAAAEPRLHVHLARPQGGACPGEPRHRHAERPSGRGRTGRPHLDRKSTRLNSSHANISYAVFCLKKKKKLHCHS